MAKILICDDEVGLRAVIKRYAVFEGHEVMEAGDGMEAIQLCRNNTFDIIIMDIMMPELDGFSAVKEIRKFSDTPIIMLSARGEEYDKVLGFEIGIDDYVVKPFSSKEIMLRIGAILRRTEKSKPAKSDEEGHIIFEKDGFKADLTAYKIFIDGVEIYMAPKEYDLLFFLVRNKNIAVPREKIMNEVWGFDYCGDDRTLLNAITHSGNDKAVIVRQKTRENTMRVEVIDHGEGISHSDLPYIWERYYKVDRKHKRPIMGTGLGLSIVKKIIDMHGGKYGVESEEGKGSIFWFELHC